MIQKDELEFKKSYAMNDKWYTGQQPFSLLLRQLPKLHDLAHLALSLRRLREFQRRRQKSRNHGGGVGVRHGSNVSAGQRLNRHLLPKSSLIGDINSAAVNTAAAAGAGSYSQSLAGLANNASQLISTSAGATAVREYKRRRSLELSNVIQ